MQFFLAPREVINCSDFGCLADLSREDTYILVVGEFPGGGYFPQDQLMFDESWGVILSKNHNHAEGSSMPGFQTGAEILYAALWPFLWLALLTVSGSLLVSCFIPAWDVVTKLALGFGLGLGVFTLTIGMTSLVGRRRSGPGCYPGGDCPSIFGVIGSICGLQTQKNFKRQYVSVRCFYNPAIRYLAGCSIGAGLFIRSDFGRERVPRNGWDSIVGS
jgi:hypothetical protein